MLSSGDLVQHRYRVQRALGTGGMATTYLVNDLVRGAEVALKLIRADEDNLTEALRAEFAKLRGVVHPNLAQVRDFGHLRSGARAGAFYTSAYIEGDQLDVYAGKKDWAQLIEPIGHALEALRFLHQLGLTHGDFKPANILVASGEGRRGVLIDLGCSHPIGTPLTTVSGTAGYLAPELLVAGAVADRRTDLYAVGATLGVLSKRASRVPRKVIRLVERLTRQRPGERPADVEEVLEALGLPSVELQLPSAQPAHLLGRKPEMKLFGNLLSRMLSNRPGPRAIWFTGPHGVGVSRLLEEAKWSAQARCAVVDSDARLAGPVSSMLRRAAEDERLPDGAAGGLAALEQLRQRGRACVLVLDNADELEGVEREIWLGLLRSIEQDDPLLVVAGGHAKVPLRAPALEPYVLGALEADVVAHWLGPRRDEFDLGEAMRLTGGFPSALCQLMTGQVGSAARERAVRDLPEAHLRALGVLAAWRASMEPQRLESIGVADPELISTLVLSGFISVDGSGVRLTRLADAKTILAVLKEEVFSQAHRVAAQLWADQRTHTRPGGLADSTCAARRAHHLCVAGELDAAEALMRHEEKLRESHPDPWVDAAQCLALERREPSLVLSAAAVLETAGRPESALSLLAMLLRTRPDDRAVRTAIRLRAGACYLRTGRAHRALGQLDRAFESAGNDAPMIRARALDLMSRALIKTSAYAEAARAAREGLSLLSQTPESEQLSNEGEDPQLCADLHDDLGVASSYLGQLDVARNHLRQASEQHQQGGRPRALARSASYCALVDYRGGDTRAAARGYRRALELAEACGASDLLSYAAQNLGVASHQLGELGEALQAYRRSLRMAVAMAETAAEANARSNLARLYADIGLLDRASEAAGIAESSARALGARLLIGSALEVQGELALAHGEARAALHAAWAAREQFAAESALREVAEAELLAGRAHLMLAEVEPAEQACDAARQLAARVDADDLSARVLLLRGRQALHRSDASQALPLLEEALRLARSCGQRALQAEVETALADAYGQRSAGLLARQHAESAAGLWERMATSLPEHMLEAFWSHPARRAEAQLASSGHNSATSTGQSRQLVRLLDINAKLNSSLDVEDVLACTIDSALELTGAERGFVILSKEGNERFEIAVARNIDPDNDEPGELRVSRSIAARVIASAEPVMAPDAQSDHRFSDQRSVHALRLRSVLAVPICGREGVMGALYLDHRFKRDLFRQAQLELLGAFANQVAIALRNARLVAQLAERGRELERERQRIEQLLAGQAVRIDQLTEEVRVKQQQLEHRYDYAKIVGASPAMQTVFSTLDRVIDAPVPVLILGESGTGKELIANAIHYNSTRKRGRLVSINCGAVPEPLLEAELFGYRKGAFTSATEDRDGLLVTARGGTVLLDELGEMPLSMQVKLLRVLQEQVVRPLGSNEAVGIDMRLLCATNRRLREDVASGRFREDLFYRVGVVEIQLPPLRERLEDIPELVDRVLQSTAERIGKPAPGVSPSGMRVLLEHSWPGNVRELENVIIKAVLLAEPRRFRAWWGRVRGSGART